MTFVLESQIMTAIIQQMEASIPAREIQEVRSSATTTAKQLLSALFRVDTAAPWRDGQDYTRPSALHMIGSRKPSRTLTPMVHRAMDAQKPFMTRQFPVTEEI